MGVAEFIVGFREIFEIALVVGIMLAYLYKTKNARFAALIYIGAALAVLVSILSAFVFEKLAGGFEANEELFEGATLVLASVFVTWLILWMFAQKNLVEKIEKGLEIKIENKERLGLVAFSFIAVFREGVEIVIFLGGIWLATGAINLITALLGGLAALGLTFGVFKHLVKLDMKTFFTYTSTALVLLAAGLLSQGVHELQEAKIIPTTIEHIYDITPGQNPDGSYSLMHEKGAIGSLLKGLVGYDTAPSLEQAVAYAFYLGAVYFAYRRVSGQQV